MIKKLLAVIISVSLIMTSFSATAFAETVSDKESFPEGISDTAGITENEDLTGARFSLENSPGENSAQDVPVAETPAELTAVQSTPEGTALSGDIGDYSITAGGNYYLSGDATGNITVAEGITAVIDLNGFVLTGGTSGPVVTNNGTLTVKDSDKTKVHYYTAGTDGLWTLNAEATSGTPYESMTTRPASGAVIAIKGGAVTGGKIGTLIGGEKYGAVGQVVVGGGVYSKGDLTIDGAVICGNTIERIDTTYLGLGIFCEGGCTLKSGAIICGNANISDKHIIKGGAVYAAATVMAQDSSISFNAVYHYGGAIYSKSDEPYSTGITIKNCVIRGNSASHGAVYVVSSGDNPVCTFENCTLDGNSARDYGGAVSIDGGCKLDITGGSISNNDAERGGAIYAEWANVNLKDVVISENTSIAGGGIELNNGNLTAENVAFEKNEATGIYEGDNRYGGGAVYVCNAEAEKEITVNLTDCSFSENSASDNGGGICADYADWTNAEDIKLNLNNCSFSGNSSGANGGGLYLGGKNTADISGGKISDNTATDAGGGLYLDASLAPDPVAIGKATLTGVEISGNKASDGGGVGMFHSAQLLMNGCTVTGNSAIGTDDSSGMGGGIYKTGEQQTNKEDAYEKIVLLNTQITGNTAVHNGGGVYFRRTEYYCFVKGTPITMADGTIKNIEDITEGDEVKTFDHEKGEFSSAKVYLAWQKENVGGAGTFTLDFDGGSTVQCIGGHDFLEKTSRKYQKLTAENAESYMGQFFFGEDGKWHELLNVSYEGDSDWSYCIYTAKHQNAFAGGMLSAPDDVDYLLNIYELDENLKADAVQLAADIEEYGLVSYEYANERAGGMSYDWYKAAGAKYMYIAFGKGLAGEQGVIDVYKDLFDEETFGSGTADEAAAVSGSDLLKLAAAPSDESASEAALKNETVSVLTVKEETVPSLEDFDAGYIYVGTGTVVTGNTAESGKNNVFLEPSKKDPDGHDEWERVETLIKVCKDATDMDIGVSVAEPPTAETAIQVTTADNNADYSQYFTSDNAAYTAYNRGVGSEQQIVIGTEVAVIAETGIAYGTVQAAINAASNGQTVKMVADSTENVIIGNGSDRSKTVILDLNGKTLKSTGTGEGGARNNAITNYATLTIADSSTNGTGKITGGTGSVKGKTSIGGGVYNTGGTLTMTGGTITGNTASLGGGLANVESGIFNMTGGVIKGNAATVNGGGVFNDGTMNVSGTAKVMDNTLVTGEDATANNIYLPGGKTITVETAGLSKGAAFGVTTQNDPSAGVTVPVTGKNSDNYSKYFSSDKGYLVINEGSGENQVVALTDHIHSWTYELAKTAKDNDTIEATCDGEGECALTDTTLTIMAPESTEYDGSEKNASFAQTSFCGSNTLPAITYEYKAEKNGTYVSVTDTVKPGYYKASFTAGKGTGARTAYVEYTVSRKQLKVSGTTTENKPYDGTAEAKAAIGTVSGKCGTEDVKVSVDSASFDNKNAATGKTVTVTYKITGTAAGNYIKPEDDKLKADITKVQLTVKDTSVSGKTYDATVTANASVGTVSGIIGNDDVRAEVGSAYYADRNVGKGKQVTVVYKLTGDDAGNYIKPEDDKLKADITQKSINVQADDKTSYVGSPLAALTYTADKLCGTDVYTGVLTTDADNDTVGKYDITQGTLTAGNNYLISFKDGEYEVTDKEVQTLVFAGVSGGNVEKTYGDPAFTEAVSGAHSAVTYTSSASEVASVDSSTGQVTIHKTGSAVIKAQAAETAEYAAASAQYILTVNKVRVAVPASVTGLEYNAQEQTGVVPAAGPVYTLTGNTAVNAGTYKAVASLNDKTNYAWNTDVPVSEDQNIYWSIAAKQVTVAANDITISLGSSVPAFTAEETGLIGTDKVVYSFNTVKPEVQGVYSIVPDGEKEQGNYTVTYVRGELTVTGADSSPKASSEDLARVLDKYSSKEEYRDKTLDVIVRTDGAVSQAEKNLITIITGYKKAVFYDTDLYLIINDAGVTTEKNIGNENDTLISVTYKFDFSNKKNIQTLRVHNGVVGEIKETPNAAGEYVKYDKTAGTITVTASRYSTYAFAYSEAGSVGTGDTDNIALYILLAAISAGAVCALFVIRRRVCR